MRKKQLLKINENLFLQLEETKATILELKKENSDLKAQLDKLNSENEYLRKNQSVSSPLISLDEKVKTQANLPKDTQYAAEIIGKIIIEATKRCNILTNSSNPNIKDLVNLILGRTEVAKAKILKTVNSSLSLEEKISAINNHKADAEDYFESVMAQKS